MAKPVSLDTNCLLRWSLQDIPEQADAVGKLLQTYNNISVADLAVAEMVFALEIRYKLPRSLVAEYVEAIMSMGQVSCNKTLFHRVLPVYRNHPALSFVDICLAVYAELNGTTPLFTFDKKLARQLEPTQLLQ